MSPTGQYVDTDVNINYHTGGGGGEQLVNTTETLVAHAPDRQQNHSTSMSSKSNKNGSCSNQLKISQYYKSVPFSQIPSGRYHRWCS